MERVAGITKNINKRITVMIANKSTKNFVEEMSNVTVIKLIKNINAQIKPKPAIGFPGWPENCSISQNMNDVRRIGNRNIDFE